MTKEVKVVPQGSKLGPPVSAEHLELPVSTAPKSNGRRQGLVHIPTHHLQNGSARAETFPETVLVHGQVEIGIDVAPAPPGVLAISREMSIDAGIDTLTISRDIGIIVESPCPQEETKRIPVHREEVLPPPSHQGQAGSPQSKEAVSVRRKRRAPLLTYEAAMWIIHLVLLVLSCVDRFVWNVWPRQNTFKIGSGFAGKDKTDGLLDGPWSVKLYDILARVSGRFSILALNLLLFVRLRTVESWLSTSWINDHVVDCSNIVNANLRLHVWNGVAMVILMLLHVWSILFPCIFHGFGAQVLAGTFEWPLSERKPPGFKDANSTAQMMSLQVDDVFRVAEITVIFGFLAPLSYFWFWRKWHIAIHVHRVMAAIFCIDIVRRHTHPHSILLNIPVFVLWILDKLVFSYWEYSSVSQFHRILLGEDYMVLLWKSDGPLSKTLGPNFYLKLKNSSLTENAHAFTAFQNRRMAHLKDVQGDWNTGTVIRVYRKKRKYPLSKQDGASHTGRMADADKTTAVLEAYGPYTGEMSELIKHGQNKTHPNCCGARSFLPCGSSGSNTCQRCLTTISRVFQGDGPVVLIGTGSGINYLLDAIQFHFTEGHQLILLWSTGDNFLFSWVRKLVNQVVSREDTHLRVVLANTDKYSMIRQAWSEANQLNAVSESRDRNTRGPEELYNSENDHPGIVRYISGRIPFEEEIPRGSQVFFQGSRVVREAVEAACRRNQCTVYCGRGSNYVRKIVFKELAQRSLVYVNRSYRRISSAVDELHLRRRLSQVANISFRSTPGQSRGTSMRAATLQPDVLTTDTSRRHKRGYSDGHTLPYSRETSLRRNTLHPDSAYHSDLDKPNFASRGRTLHSNASSRSRISAHHGPTIFENRAFVETPSGFDSEPSSCDFEGMFGNHSDATVEDEKVPSEVKCEANSENGAVVEHMATSGDEEEENKEIISSEDKSSVSKTNSVSYSYGDYSSSSDDSYDYHSDTDSYEGD